MYSESIQYTVQMFSAGQVDSLYGLVLFDSTSRRSSSQIVLPGLHIVEFLQQVRMFSVIGHVLKILLAVRNLWKGCVSLMSWRSWRVVMKCSSVSTCRRVQRPSLVWDQLQCSGSIRSIQG